MTTETTQPFLATARRGRPQRFADVAGQEHISTVLQGALERGKVSHAYLFSGPRGVGKTSTARILAKALNCAEGVQREPCNTCSSCRAITQGNHIDVIEIDAASNRGIDNIRDLREAVRFAPAVGRTKVYIIDEVHMLSQDAFNALLKTLEEPPDHSKFILATTEEHKVPETILSRCQRFHFKRVSIVQIIENLRRTYADVIQALNIPDSVFSYVARAARGSVRDSQSLMDQIISFAGDRVTLEDVENLLGAVEFESLLGFIQKVHGNDLDGALSCIDEISQRGRDLAQFNRDLIELYRHLMVARYSRTPQKLIDLAPEQLELVVQASKKLETETLLRALEVLFASENQMKSTVDDRLVMELATFKMAKLSESITLKDLIARIEGWESGTGNPAPQATPREKNASRATETPVPASSPPVPPVASNPTPDQTHPEPPPPILQEAENTPRKPSAEKGSNPSSLWKTFVEYIHEHSPKIANYLDQTSLIKQEGDRLTVAIPCSQEFCYNELQKKANLQTVRHSLENLFHRKMDVVWKLQDVEKDAEGESGGDDEEPDPADLIREAYQEPRIRQVMDLFDGQIVDRRIKRD